MKIRMKGNTFRLRLSKTEVGMFAAKGYVEERTDFGSDTLIYAVKSTNDETMSAGFVNGNITLYVPHHLLQQWAATNLVGLDYNMPVSNDRHLYILLEKDFKCIDAVATEDQSDYFENPAKSC